MPVLISVYMHAWHRSISRILICKFESVTLRIPKSVFSTLTVLNLRYRFSAGGGIRTLVSWPTSPAFPPFLEENFKTELVYPEEVKLMEAEEKVQCPQCGGRRVYKDRIRYTRSKEVQRYLCRNCCHRFSG